MHDETMPISKEIQRIILRQGTAVEGQVGRESVGTWRQSGPVKVKHGLTSVEEVLGCTTE